jgi:YD repeat-containing protein
MQNTFIPLRTLITACCLVFFLYACHKGDPGKPCCPPKRTCQAQSHLMGRTGDPVPKSHQFIKTFGPDGLPNYMDAWASAWWTGGHFKGFVKFERRRVYMLDSLTLDTVVMATLDDCGRPIRSFAKDPVFGGTSYGSYYYDSRGRLSKMGHGWNSPDGEFFTYTYDSYDNIIRIDRVGAPSRYQLLKYDYSKPIKGGYYDLGLYALWAPLVMEFLGLLDTQPHHQLIQLTNEDQYPTGVWNITDQTVNAQGYLTGYLVDADLTRRTLTWNCGGHKY